MFKIEKEKLKATKITEEEREQLEKEILKNEAVLIDSVIYSEKGFYILEPSWAKYCIFDPVSEIAYFSKRKESVKKPNILIDLTTI